MVDRQERIVLGLLLSCVHVLLHPHGSRGLDLAPSPALSTGSLPDHVNTPTISSPSPAALLKGPGSHPPLVSPPAFKAMSPSIYAGTPAVQPSLPRVISPSINRQPNRPIGSAHNLSPSYTSPPQKGDTRLSAPTRISPVVLPHAPDSPRNFVNPPSALPIIGRITPSRSPVPRATDYHDDNKRPSLSPMSASPSFKHGNYGIPVASPPEDTSRHISPRTPTNKSSTKGSSPMISPVPHKTELPPDTTAAAPLTSNVESPSVGISLGPATAPKVQTHHRTKKREARPVLAPSHPPSHLPGPVISHKGRHHAPLSHDQGPSPSPVQSPSSKSSQIPSSSNEWTDQSPIISPSGSVSTKPRAPLAPPVWSLPPPPPNLDCRSLTCTEPLTDPPAGSLCICVLPIKVGIRLNVAIYTFFPLVSGFAQEIASGVNMKPRQVRVMGANVGSEQPEKTVILIDLVPLQEKFDNATAFSTYESFWHKQVAIKKSLFGDYDVLYVLYPGLPSSPPAVPVNINVDDGPFGNNNNARTMKPLGVDVGRLKRKVSGSLIAIIVLSSTIAFILCTGVALLLLLKRRNNIDLPERFPHILLPKFAKSSASGSFSSSIATYTGQAKTFRLAELQRATNRFDDSRILGEGGFGCVYRGTLEDGTTVAIKVLKRYDYQGEREFLAEVEMLSRLHHRNLVKLIGICAEEHARCLIYELIPNGSVESHLHGVDKETAPLDWNARMKIAFGAARGLAYLHEDSSPSVIHRDFKSSNILLEHDFTPKVSDFGLARTAMDEGNQHISTRVMGTFGYVAPEYAMTGHLLVKSDVYSYGVVLLELLTGRKPVDMSQPPGQENLVTWARPLLTSIDGLEEIIDPALGANISFDNVAKVAAIASMCVQPEVSHRPFMGEVVQALKLVCSEYNECRGSERQEEFSAHAKAIHNRMGLDAERVLLSDMFGTSPLFSGDETSSSHRHSSSGPLMIGRSRQFWQRLRSLPTGSMSEHGFSLGFETRSEGSA
ncbi:receptor-like serine/threonine-protein kinase ALE2 isoform X2 [Typha latifolia]|uniref:receptor-like serine/threonine-protein kinase ALE2 isoform X2 n=1 Tax=Typha latifolia TaxID=4733 RepID=UPI003C2C1690